MAFSEDSPVLIIGAGMSGLAAGIRLARFNVPTLIVERHYAFGGLNSYYKLGGREFDVGLHAVTNFVPPGVRQAPLPKLLRQLSLDREEFELREQRFSDIRFPGETLRFDNGGGLLMEEVARAFPKEADRFAAFVEEARAYDIASLSTEPASARRILADRFREPLLVEMLLCPLMFYGCADENDMEFTQFITLFKSIFLEGLARPKGGVRTIIRALVRRYRGFGGKLRMQCGVERIEHEEGRITAVVLEDGSSITPSFVLSSAGYHETLRLCGPACSSEPRASLCATLPTEPRRHASGGPPSTGGQGPPCVEHVPSEPILAAPGPGKLSFVESVCVLDRPPATLGHQPTITFFSNNPRFLYRPPNDLVDPDSGVICCPNNYDDHGHLPEGIIRFTSLANYERWRKLWAGSASGDQRPATGANATSSSPTDPAYAAAKDVCHDRIVSATRAFLFDPRPHTVFRDTFTPLTIERYTGHLSGAIYGAPRKRRDGRTPLDNLFICGTDQGYLGIVGALLSGITIANLHVLNRI